MSEKKYIGVRLPYVPHGATVAVREDSGKYRELLNDEIVALLNTPPQPATESTPATKDPKRGNRCRDEAVEYAAKLLASGVGKNIDPYPLGDVRRAFEAGWSAGVASAPAGIVWRKPGEAGRVSERMYLTVHKGVVCLYQYFGDRHHDGWIYPGITAWADLPSPPAWATGGAA